MSDKLILLGFSGASYLLAFLIKFIYCRRKWEAPGKNRHNTPYNWFLLLGTALLFLSTNFLS